MIIAIHNIIIILQVLKPVCPSKTSRTFSNRPSLPMTRFNLCSGSRSSTRKLLILPCNICNLFLKTLILFKTITRNCWWSMRSILRLMRLVYLSIIRNMCSCLEIYGVSRNPSIRRWPSITENSLLFAIVCSGTLITVF